jgi:hypothetical protein
MDVSNELLDKIGPLQTGTRQIVDSHLKVVACSIHAPDYHLVPQHECAHEGCTRDLQRAVTTRDPCKNEDAVCRKSIQKTEIE